MHSLADLPVVYFFPVIYPFSPPTQLCALSVWFWGPEVAHTYTSYSFPVFPPCNLYFPVSSVLLPFQAGLEKNYNLNLPFGQASLKIHLPGQDFLNCYFSLVHEQLVHIFAHRASEWGKYERPTGSLVCLFSTNQKPGLTNLLGQFICWK